MTLAPAGLIGARGEPAGDHAKAMSGQHPVEHLFGLLKGFSYPDGLVPVPQRIPGTAFFPGGYGLWRKTRGGLPPMPCGKVMVLGNNFDSECGYGKSLQKGDELHTPTWQNLLQLFRSVGIRPEDCFFTNAYLGLLAGCPPNTGESPGARNSSSGNVASRSSRTRSPCRNLDSYWHWGGS